MQSESIPFCKAHLLAKASKPVTDLLDEVGLLTLTTFPTASQLNDLARVFQQEWDGPIFKGQSTFSEDESRYYETIIGEDNVVPTRENNWHDLFNALIWLQFPKSKRYLNKLHIDDIRSHGVSPRTARRNRITHFDECGVVLAVETPTQEDSAAQTAIEQWLSDLAHHKWQQVFIQDLAIYEQHITPFMFGHANLEMMLNPFIGLTGKWLAVSVPYGFSKMTPWEQRARVDDALLMRFAELEDFELSPILKPVPLLGIPGWHDVQTQSFYKDTSYFRPLRENAKATVALPLWRK
jgi:hypothetical protein